MAGLWVLLGISIGAALVWLCIVKLWESSQKKRGGGGGGKGPSIKVSSSDGDESESPVSGQ